MGDVGDYFRDWKEHRRQQRAKYGIECPKCRELRPRTNASILMPGQRCRVDGFVAPRKAEQPAETKPATTISEEPA